MVVERLRCAGRGPGRTSFKRRLGGRAGDTTCTLAARYYSEAEMATRRANENTEKEDWSGSRRWGSGTSCKSDEGQQKVVLGKRPGSLVARV